MRDILVQNLFVQNLLIQIKQVKRNMMLIAVPIFIFLFIYLFFSNNQVEYAFITPLSVGIIDEDDSLYSGMLIESFRNNNSFSKFVNLYGTNPSAIRADFEAGSLDALIIIPEGFTINLNHVNIVPLDVRINYDNAIKAYLFKNVMLGYERFLTSVEKAIILLYDELEAAGMERELIYVYNEQIAIDLIFTSLGRHQFFDFQPLVNIPAVVTIKYYFIAIGIMFLMYISVFAAINLMREEENGCISRLKVSGRSVLAYIFSKTMAASVFVFLIVLIWYSLFLTFYGQGFKGAIFYLALFLFACIYFDLALAICIAAWSKREEAVVLISSIFIFMNAILGGSIIPIHYMPIYLQKLAKLSPNYWMIRGFLLIDSQYKLNEFYLISLILMIMATLIVMLASYKIRRRV